MSEFKIGDRVRVSYLYSDQVDGKLGTFERYEGQGRLHMVRVPGTTQGAEGGGEVWALYAHEVEPAPELKVGDRVIVPHPGRGAVSPMWPKAGRIMDAGRRGGWLVRVPGWLGGCPVHREDDELTLAPSRMAAE